MSDSIDPNVHEITIDPDITRAWTLPTRAYTSPAFFQQQRHAIFARSWQYVCDLNDVRIPQQVHPTVFLEGMLEEPLLLTRDKADTLRCMSNVCTHRGALVAEQPGMHAHLRCRYHGRRWDLDGTFQSMPEFEQVENFPQPCDNLTPFEIATLGPLVFAAIDPAHSFNAWVADIRARLGWLPFDQLIFDPTRSRDYLVRANWMLYCDNYLEGFHIPFVHASLNAVIDYADYPTELFDHGNLQMSISSGGDHTFDELPNASHSPDHGRGAAGYYYWLWPNLMLNFYPWGLSMNIVKPLAVDRTKITYRTYIWDEGSLDQGAGAGLDRVEREDEAVVESVQRGMASRTYDRGRYSPTREQCVHHFHQMIASTMAAPS